LQARENRHLSRDGTVIKPEHLVGVVHGKPVMVDPASLSSGAPGKEPPPPEMVAKLEEQHAAQTAITQREKQTRRRNSIKAKANAEINATA
jgi:hypothetical protein